MHDIIYSLYEMMRIICDPIYTMNSTWVNTCNRNKYGQCTRFSQRISDIEINNIILNSNDNTQKDFHIRKKHYFMLL